MDVGGALKVGPASAGADPGPACYGHGGDGATVTDANMLLGRLRAEAFLGGKGGISLDLEGSAKVFEDLADRLDLNEIETALGVVSVANAAMESALRLVSVERGFDPRGCTLIPFGGAGPLHACDLAESLDIVKILIPRHPGVLSALGLVMADVVHDASLAVLSTAERLLENPSSLEDSYLKISGRIREVLVKEGVSLPKLEAALDLRYAGQSYEISVPFDGLVVKDGIRCSIGSFHKAHEERYGYSCPAEDVEVVAVRVRGVGSGRKLPLVKQPLGDANPEKARTGRNPVWFDADGPEDCPCYDRDRLKAGMRIDGPALVTQFDTTVLIRSRWRCRVDPWLNLVLER